jgi:hypothetical protein
MGALLTYFQVRIPSQRRIELTNPDNESAVTENTVVSGAAETDVTNTFLHMTGVAFDSTDAEHLTIGVDGIVYFLYKYRGLPLTKAGDAAYQTWKTACDAFARTRGALAWQSPLTNSTLLPSRDPDNSLPYFDRENLTSLIPPAPSLADPWDPLAPSYGQ